MHHDSLIYVTWLICTCDMTISYMWHDSLAHVAWLIRTCDMSHSYMWHVSFIHVTRLIHTCDVFIRVKLLIYTCDWIIHTCDMTHAYTWHDLFSHLTWLVHTSDIFTHVTWLNVTWLMHTFGMTYPYMRLDSSIRATRLMHTCDTTRLHMRHSLQTHRFVAFSRSEKAKSLSWKPTRRRCARNFTRTHKAQKSLPKIKILTRKKNAQPEISEEEMRATFDSWDKDGDGLTYCTSKELYVHRIFHNTTRNSKSFWKGRSGDAWTFCTKSTWFSSPNNFTPEFSQNLLVQGNSKFYFSLSSPVPT